MNYIYLKENLQQARKILKKYNVEEDSQDFKQLRSMIEGIFGQNQLGYIGLAAKFRYRNKLDFNGLSSLFMNIHRNKKLLKNLPKQVVAYKDPEELQDDLSSVVEWATYNKEFVQRLKGDFKKEAREDEELKDAYIGLEDKVKEDLVKNFLPKIARYRSYDDFRISVFNYLSSPDNSEEIIKKINDTEGINVVYNKDGIIVAEVFTYEASCAVGSKSWCISTGRNWWDNYNSLSSGNKQYFLWNLNIPSTNIKSRVGVTIKPNGSVKTAHLKNDEFVNFDNYIKNYGIDRDIFKPLDQDDLDKIIDMRGLTNEVIKFIQEKDNGREILMKYKDRIPKSKAIFLGLLSEDQLKGMSKTKSLIYSNQKSEMGVEIIRVCNLVNNIEELKKNNKMVFNMISEMSFIDKVKFAEKYHEAHRYNNENKTSFSDNGVNIFFDKEIDESKYPLSVEVDSWNSNITFEFEMDKDEYIDEILDTTEEYYYSIESLSSYDTYHLTNMSSSEEDNYLHRYFDNKSEKLLKEYFDILKKYIVHDKVIKKIDEFLKEFEEGFIEFSEMVSYYDPKFNTDNYNSGESYFYRFIENLESSAADVVQEDANEWENKKIGSFEEVSYPDSITAYKVSSTEILNSLDIESFNEIGEIDVNSWLESGPSSVDRANFHFYDYAHATSFLGEADTTIANEGLHERLQEAIDEEIFGDQEEEKEEIETISKYEKDLLNNGYEPYIDEGWGRLSFYYALKFKKRGDVVDVEYKDDDSDDVKVKKEKQDLYYIINKNDIELDGSCWLYILKKPYKYYTSLSYSNSISDMFKSNKKDLIEKGIDIKRIKIGESMVDPNQLKFKFEGIKSFNSFKQSKLR